MEKSLIKTVATALIMWMMAMGATGAKASVVYTYTSPALGNFVYTSSSFIAANLTVPAPSLDSSACFLGTCTSMTFYVDAVASGLTGIPSSAIAFGQSSVTNYSYFSPGALGVVGSYNTIFNFNVANLTVAEVTDNQVPEPSTIALFGVALLSLFGFGLVRRRVVT